MRYKPCVSWSLLLLLPFHLAWPCRTSFTSSNTLFPSPPYSFPPSSPLYSFNCLILIPIHSWYFNLDFPLPPPATATSNSELNLSSMCPYFHLYYFPCIWRQLSHVIWRQVRLVCLTHLSVRPVKAESVLLVFINVSSHLTQSLSYRRHSITICWMNQQINEWLAKESEL